MVSKTYLLMYTPRPRYRTPRYRSFSLPLQKFSDFFPKKKGFVTIFKKIPRFGKIFRSNFIARIDTGFRISRTFQDIPGNPRKSQEISEIPILQPKLLYFGKFLVLLYYNLLLRQSALLPLLFAIVTGLTAQKVTVARSWCNSIATKDK